MKHGSKRGLPSAAALRARAEERGAPLSEEQASSLRRFGELLLQKAVPLGLISERDTGRLSERHLMDSLRATPLLTPAGRSVFDLGSGSGLPGIPLAIALPASRFLLIESRRKAVGFLEYAMDELQLDNVEVRSTRAEEVTERADVTLSRAFAPLEQAWALAARLLKPGGRLIYFAGRGFGDLEEATEGLEPPPERVELLAKIRPLVIMTRS